jgi:hypothetical protein
VSGRNITVTGISNLTGDYWEAGYVHFNNERRLINRQTGTGNFKLNIQFRDTPLNQTVRVLPGCKLRRVLDCHQKFNNVLRYGGFSWVPLRNPHDGGGLD